MEKRDRCTPLGDSLFFSKLSTFKKIFSFLRTSTKVSVLELLVWYQAVEGSILNSLKKRTPLCTFLKIFSTVFGVAISDNLHENICDSV